MQLQNRYPSLNTKEISPLAKSKSDQRQGDNRRQWYGLKQLLGRLSIKQKIGYGYAVAVGVAVLGTGTGLTVGDYYQRQAKEKFRDAREQQLLLNDLQHNLDSALLEAARLGSASGNAAAVSKQKAEFWESAGQVGLMLGKLERFMETRDISPEKDNQGKEDLGVGTLEIEAILEAYGDMVAASSRDIQSILPQIAAGDNLSGKGTPAALIGADESAAALVEEFTGLLEVLSGELARIMEQAKAHELAARVEFDRAEVWRRQITISSLLLSGAIAALLAYVTSRAIARPIEWLTQVAQRATTSSNYQLRVPIITNDEVGVLANSFNQLIEQVQRQLEEINQTQAQLIQSEKMSSLGRLVAGIAHEINNPLSFITGNIEHSSSYIQDLMELVSLYQKEYPQPPAAIREHIEAIDLEFLYQDLPKILDSMNCGADRICHIVQSLRHFSRLQEADTKQVNIHSGIDSTLMLLNHRLDGIMVIKNYGELPQIECYPAYINQLFKQILTNAIDAFDPESGSHFRDKQPEITITTYTPNPTHVAIKIADNGSGIDTAHTTKIFDPFFTTKPPGKGTGMGLAICYQIAQKHGGSIQVISQPGHGAEFILTLPISPPRISG
ncbi:MAG TPA: HAMP domain-containing protein [Oscillatoriaceae cyanobacterium M33_DOE_052]|nr:HAMP domain-containing protein [Oscillatoriaceae cyanobacterium M33_DOE_052]